MQPISHDTLVAARHPYMVGLFSTDPEIEARLFARYQQYLCKVEQGSKAYQQGMKLMRRLIGTSFEGSYWISSPAWHHLYRYGRWQRPE